MTSLLLALSILLAPPAQTRPTTGADSETLLIVSPNTRISVTPTVAGSRVEAAEGGGLMAPLERFLHAPERGEKLIAIRTRRADGTTTRTAWMRVRVEGEPRRPDRLDTPPAPTQGQPILLRRGFRRTVCVSLEEFPAFPEVSVVEWTPDEGLWTPADADAPKSASDAFIRGGALALVAGDELTFFVDAGAESRPISGRLDGFPIGPSKTLNIGLFAESRNELLLEFSDDRKTLIRTAWTLLVAPPEKSELEDAGADKKASSDPAAARPSAGASQKPAN